MKDVGESGHEQEFRGKLYDGLVCHHNICLHPSPMESKPPTKLSSLNNGLILSAVGASLYWLHDNVKRFHRKRQIPSPLTKSPYASELQLAIKLALQAGSNMMAFYDEKGTESESNHDLGITTKGRPEDFCTKIDVLNEQLILEGIRLHCTSHCIIGEESVGTGSIPPLTDKPTWIIDPIDGTTNFAAGLPLTCVSIGFCDKGKPVMGVVYAPMTDELYMAIKGYGAYRNGVRIARQHDAQTLPESVVCFEFGYARSQEAISTMTNAVKNIMERGCRSTRSLGSGVLDLCYVATGRLDVVYAGLAGEGWKPWDYCAGVVIANEAGCAVEAIDQAMGQVDFDLYSESIICAGNQDLLHELREVIQQH